LKSDFGKNSELQQNNEGTGRNWFELHPFFNVSRRGSHSLQGGRLGGVLLSKEEEGRLRINHWGNRAVKKGERENRIAQTGGNPEGENPEGMGAGGASKTAHKKTAPKNRSEK